MQGRTIEESVTLGEKIQDILIHLGGFLALIKTNPQNNTKVSFKRRISQVCPSSEQ